jgi:hypothetical protein
VTYTTAERPGRLATGADVLAEMATVNADVAEAVAAPEPLLRTPLM